MSYLVAIVVLQLAGLLYIREVRREHRRRLRVAVARATASLGQFIDGLFRASQAAQEAQVQIEKLNAILRSEP